MRVTTFLKTEIGASLYSSPSMSMGPCIIVLALESDGGKAVTQFSNTWDLQSFLENDPHATVYLWSSANLKVSGVTTSFK